eukprot:CAMPEP_0170444702 /NCGR_PEP_ID=MMETSP0117_2-20130122/48671_1 /TAXON_ID=400756 /ORGANISM="Durinskia baltica, Strain CSIRO CS-38" /LENGTH=46 /DNA_ID= /DNA_START= /DNA_END= /DNA_ORIENTATION=
MRIARAPPQNTSVAANVAAAALLSCAAGCAAPTCVAKASKEPRKMP